MTRDRKIYLIVGGILVVLLVVMLVTFDNNRDNADAQAKAQTLSTALKAANIPVQADTAQIAQVLGDDGGNVCGMTGSDFAESLAKTNLSVGGEFYRRPIVIQRRVLDTYLIIVGIYCPEKLEDAKEFAGSLKTTG